jgi:hypothetical protein
MSSTATRVSAALAITALLTLPASPAVATTAVVRSQASTASTATAPGFFEQSWRFLADLLGVPTGATPDAAARRHGLTSRHSDLGGFIDPDGARFLSQAPGTLVGTP